MVDSRTSNTEDACLRCVNKESGDSCQEGTQLSLALCHGLFLHEAVSHVVD